MPHIFRSAVLILAASVISASAYAQQNGARVAGSFAGTFGEGETNIAAGGAVGYRFTPHVGFDLEAIALPDLELRNAGTGGRGVVFLTNFVAEFPSPARWLTPYVQGGGGVANVSQTGFVIDSSGTTSNGRLDPRLASLGRDAGRNRNVPMVDFRSDNGPHRSETGVALSVGGGVDFTVWHGLAVGPSISYLRLFGTLTDLDLTRVGLRTSYRF